MKQQPIFAQVKALIITLLVLNLIEVFPQQSIALNSDNKEIALKYFTNGLYEKALPYYAEFLKKFPKDPDYSYYYGVCLLETGKIAESINILRYASTQEVSANVYYYLGKAYHYDYQFLRAIQFYKRYQFNADITKEKEKDIERLANMCYNGVYLLKYISEPEVIYKEKIYAIDFYKSYKTENLNGKLIEKPSKLKTIKEIELNQESIMFVPNIIETNNILFFSGLNEDGENGKDIFMIKKVGEGKWSAPENLGNIINTPYDEEYPYMDETGTLYFCSKGHYSMGGYDIYKATYSKETNTWSPPENLDFPINSPFDDILFIPDEFSNYAVFCSDRNCAKGEMEKYKIKISEQPEQKEITDYNIIKKLAMLNPSEITEQKPQKPNIEIPEDTIMQPEIIEEIKKIEVHYQLLLSKALQIQHQIDSLEIQNKNIRKQILENPEEQEKNKLRKNLENNSIQIKELQELANEQYKKIKNIEQNFILKYIDHYAITDRPKKAKVEDFLLLKEVIELIGEKNINYIKSINSEITQNHINIENTKNLEEQQKELKALSKSTKDKKELKKIDKSIKKIEKEIYSTKFEAFDAIHKNTLEKYNIYREYIPIAKPYQDNDIILEWANDRIDIAVKYLQKAGNIHENLDKYTKDNYKIKKLISADTLNLKSMKTLETAIMALLNYEIDDGKPTQISQKFKSEKYAIDETIDSILNSYKKLVKEEDIAQIDSITINDSTLAISQQMDSVELDNTDNFIEIIDDKTNTPIFGNEFEIMEKSPYNKDNPISMDFNLPQGIIYRIQLGVYSAEANPEKFKGFYPITGEITTNGLYKYYAGLFKRYKSAENVTKIIKKEGFSDAFIVAYNNGEKIPTEKAITFEPKTSAIIAPEIKKDTLPVDIEKESVVIKIQIGAFKGTMPEDILNNFKSLSVDKVIEEYLNENGIRIYTIGNFYNFDKAKKFKNYLIDKGHQGIFLVAFKNGGKINIADAIKKLNN